MARHSNHIKLNGIDPSRRMARVFVLLTCAICIEAIAARVGAGTADPAALKEGNVMDARPVSADEQRKRFVLPEGFVIELVASEVDGVAKPTSMAFDDAGRLWCTTATAYSRDLNPAVWREPGPDRILVMDALHKGTKIRPRVFADQMVMPMSVLPQGNGAFVAQGSEIFRLDDTDGDGRADQRKVLLRGFGVQDTHTLPHQIVHL